MQENKIVKNAAWIIVCRVMQSVLSLIVSMLTARYLGPSNYGVINYAAAVVAFVVPLMQLGFRNTLVREFVNEPEKEGEILGTALVFNLVSALLCIVGVFSFVYIANHGETETIVVCVLYSLNLIFQALEMSQYWFQVKLLSKYTAVVSLFAYAVVTVYRIFLLITQKSIFWFAISQALDFMLISVTLLIIYEKISNQRLQFSWKTGCQMLSSSKHYIISSLMVTVFGHVGSIFLKFLVDDAAVGYYSAAVSCASMTSFVYAAIVDSLRPIILKNKQTSNMETFEKNNIYLYSIVIYLSLIQGIMMCMFAPLIVKILYGCEYMDAIMPLQIMAFYPLFSNIGMVRNVWILAQEKQKYLWIINLTGAVANILLNFILIPIFGISGAAIASVLTQIIANVVIGFVLKSIRENNRLMLKSLNLSCILRVLKKHK
jgi:O-antigen/teichoic acid export membrane protein